MNILIVENEPLVVADLRTKLNQLGYSKLRDADNVEEAIIAIETEIPDIILIDIELNGDKDGIVLGQIANQKKIPFLYLSDLQDMATFERARATNPQTNLPKPVSLLQLRNSLLEIHSAPELTPEYHKFIAVTHNGQKIKLNKQEIIYLKAAGNHCEIYLSKDKRYVSSVPMNKVMSTIDSPNFVRVQRSYIVNLNKVVKYNGNLIYLEGIPEPVQMKDSFRPNFLQQFDSI